MPTLPANCDGLNRKYSGCPYEREFGARVLESPSHELAAAMLRQAIDDLRLAHGARATRSSGASMTYVDVLELRDWWRDDAPGYGSLAYLCEVLSAASRRGDSITPQRLRRDLASEIAALDQVIDRLAPAFSSRIQGKHLVPLGVVDMPPPKAKPPARRWRASKRGADTGVRVG